MAWRLQDQFHPSSNYRHLRHPRTYLSMTDFSNLYCSQALQRDCYILEQVEFSWPSVSTSVIIFHPSTKLQTTASSYLSRIDSRSTSCLALLGFPRGVRIFMVTSASKSDYGRLRRPQTHLLNTNSDFGSAGHLAFVQVVVKGLTPPCFTTVSY